MERVLPTMTRGQTHVSGDRERSMDRTSLVVVVGLCALKLLVHLVLVNRYGDHGDELYFSGSGSKRARFRDRPRFRRGRQEQLPLFRLRGPF
jgi:hypothetical protein